VLAVATFYSAAENARKIASLENRISSFSVEASVDFSWPTGSNPLLDNGNDGGAGESELFWLSTPSGLVKLYSPSGYTITRTGATSARFTATLAPKNGAAPLGRQLDSLKAAKDYSIFVLLKGYWTNGRDNYPLTIDRHRVVFRINNHEASHEEGSVQNVMPERATDAIWGLLAVHGKVAPGLAGLFE
jgi:hypothetical protein